MNLSFVTTQKQCTGRRSVNFILYSDVIHIRKEYNDRGIWVPDTLNEKALWNFVSTFLWKLYSLVYLCSRYYYMYAVIIIVIVIIYLQREPRESELKFKLFSTIFYTENLAEVLYSMGYLNIKSIKDNDDGNSKCCYLTKIFKYSIFSTLKEKKGVIGQQCSENSLLMGNI